MNILGDLMTSLSSLDGRRAMVKQVSSSGKQHLLKDQTHLGTLNSWILEYSNAPLCEDFLCDMIRLVGRLKLELKVIFRKSWGW